MPALRPATLRLPALLSLLLALVAVVPLTVPAAEAQTVPSIEGARVVAPGADYASERFSNPWDYSDRADILLDSPGPTEGLTNAALAGGRLRFDLAGSGYLSPLWVGFPAELPERHSGPIEPVNAERYQTAAIRAYSSTRTPAALMWFGTCREFRNECLGGRPFTLEVGWHTYVFPIQNTFPGLPQQWTGLIPGLRLAVNASSPTHVELDWLRIHRAGEGTTVTWDPATGTTLYWDADTDRANNTADSPGWGVVAAGANGSARFPSDAYPPGTYHFFTERSGHSNPLVVDNAPLPAIDDPDFTGGQDYPVAALGDAWDFANPADAAALGNVTNVEWSGGQLHATNTSNDPFVRLRLAAAGIDATRFHRLTVRMSYDGPFGLQDAPGGGTHGRLIWWRADTADTFHNSREIVTWRDRTTYSVDLATNPPAEVEAPEDAHRLGWTGAHITMLRWDPNEDPGARRWRLDDVKLAADDEARGTFVVRWHDNNAAATDAKVSLYYDTDRYGFDGTLIAADLTNNPAGSAYTWHTGGIPGGTYWLYAVSSNGVSTSRTYASGPLVLHETAPPAPAHPEARIAGKDRIETALALARQAFPDRAPAAVLARAGDFPDALAAAPLASAAGGPLLLNHADHLDPRVRDELARLGVERVYLMGGNAAQSPEVEAAVRSLPGVTTERVAGRSRYATAAEAARKAVQLWQKGGDPDAGEHVLVAVGTTFPDALAAGPLAARAHRPLLLVTPESAPDDTRAAAADLRVAQVTVVGGPRAVPDAVAREVAPGADIARIAGPSRYDTATLAAQAALDAGADGDVVLVAAGNTFPDALAAGPAVAAVGGVLLLTDRDVLVEPTRAWVARRQETLSFLKVAGGTAALSDAVVHALLQAAGKA